MRRVSVGGGRNGMGEEKETYVHENDIVVLLLHLFDALSTILDGYSGELRVMRGSESASVQVEKSTFGRGTRTTHLHPFECPHHDLPNEAVILRQQHLHILRMSSRHRR
jgi:hypothetical protein